MTTDETRALVQQTLLEAGATGDLAAAIRTRASDHLIVHLANGEVGGVDLAAATAQELYGAMPDASLTLDGLVVDGDRAVVMFTLSGTHTGPIRGYAPTGKPVHIPMAIAFLVGGAEFIELRYYSNLFAPLVAGYRETHQDEAV
jgi:predicted ester cyclase